MNQNKIKIKGIYIIEIMALLVFISIISSSCVPNIEDLSEEEKLYYFKTQNIKENNKLNKILSKLDFKDKYKFNSVEIKSDKDPFEINIKLKIKNGKVAKKDDFRIDASILFAISEDLDYISFFVFNDEEEFFIFSREEVDDEMISIFGEDTKKLGSTLTNFTKLHKYYQVVKNNNNDLVIDSHIGDLIESNIDVIISESKDNNSLEYNKIISENGSLDYILEQFLKRNVKNDRRGEILKRAAIDLLGPINNVQNSDSLKPLEWYKELEILTSVKLNTDLINYDNEYKQLVYNAYYDKFNNMDFLEEDAFTIVGIDIKGVFENENILKIYSITRSINALLYENGEIINICDYTIPNIVVYEKVNDKYILKEMIEPNINEPIEKEIERMVADNIDIKNDFLNISYDILNEDIQKNIKCIMEKNRIKKYNIDNFLDKRSAKALLLLDLKRKW